ncbi:hypothetical protein BO86DRAFT_225293 [Aspergillus japonicus CBS 114.51]|uniref:Uncharacterized protein n=1 Tax=Aspergillus japonicus CBS 114.51 TaxID=1448312 RepID=A0A8T8WNT4_ASPJA|nr:hypothetical protein BO86DRAFT_225293 [Aspergillus japonicus CBS 114.51]RAH77262.1 hypothetical protein BO86DRAFT_225293 [Aspergillus japonicus CBS 114.51]
MDDNKQNHRVKLPLEESDRDISSPRPQEEIRLDDRLKALLNKIEYNKSSIRVMNKSKRTRKKN